VQLLVLIDCPLSWRFVGNARIFRSFFRRHYQLTAEEGSGVCNRFGVRNKSYFDCAVSDVRTELGELKKQLEELLDKQFIRPSVSLQCCWLRRRMAI
jgi:hypothetical protein